MEFKPSRKRRCVHLTQPSKPDPTLSSLNRVRDKSVRFCRSGRVARLQFAGPRGAGLCPAPQEGAFVHRLTDNRSRRSAHRPRREYRTLHAVGLRHPVSTGRRRPRLCRVRARAGVVRLIRGAKSAPVGRRRARSDRPIPRTQGRARRRRHGRQPERPRRGIPKARQAAGGAWAPSRACAKRGFWTGSAAANRPARSPRRSCARSGARRRTCRRTSGNGSPSPSN